MNTLNSLSNNSGAKQTMDVLNDTIDNLTLSATNALNIIAGNILSLVSGARSNSGAIFSYGTLNNSSGAHLANFGALSNHGTINNASGAHLASYRSLLNQEGATNNYGTLINYGGLNNIGDGLLWNYGTFINAAGATFTSYAGSGLQNLSGAVLSITAR
jgi:hypothetical protein